MGQTPESVDLNGVQDRNSRAMWQLQPMQTDYQTFASERNKCYIPQSKNDKKRNNQLDGMRHGPGSRSPIRGRGWVGNCITVDIAG
jgi:hypothetical protein